MLKIEELKLVSEWDKTFPKSEKVVCKRCMEASHAHLGFTFPKANWNVSSPFCFSCQWQTRRQRYRIRHQAQTSVEGGSC